jgi:hypothetical protein
MTFEGANSGYVRETNADVLIQAAAPMPPGRLTSSWGFWNHQLENG